MFIAALAATASAAAAQEPAQDPLAAERAAGERGVALDRVLRLYESYGFSGTVLVALNGSIVLHRGYGLADREHDIPNTPATRFELNSITKTFTGAAILQLEAKGSLHPSDLVSRYLGQFPPWKANVTIEHLATHTAGLVADGVQLETGSRDEFVASVKNAPMASRPGARYRYTNTGFSMLAAIIEHISGASYETYLRDHFFGPLGLSSATFRGSVPASVPMARGYRGTPGTPRAPDPEPYAWGAIGADGIIATVADTYRWVVALQDGRVLAEPQRRRLFGPRTSRREAYGWHVGKSAWGTAMWDKGGASATFASHLLVFPDDHLAIVWASNDVRQQWRRALNTTLPLVALGRPVRLPPQPARARADLAPLAGAYDTPGGPVYLRATDDFLYARRNAVGIPADVRFLARTPVEFVAYDPAAMEAMTLNFTIADGAVTAEFRRGSRSIFLQKRP